MRLLHRVLAPDNLLPLFPVQWGPPPGPSVGPRDAILSVLYSDVGNFYETCGPDLGTRGWTGGNAQTTLFRTDRKLSPTFETSQAYNLLDYAALQEVLSEDDILMEKEWLSQPNDQMRFSFLPGDHNVEFQIKRVTLCALLPLDPSIIWPPQVFGAHIKRGKDEVDLSLAYAAWTYEIRPVPPRLIITRLRCNVETFPTLISAALKTAAEFGMEIVEVWNIPMELVDLTVKLGGETRPFEDHWPCYSWYGKSNGLNKNDQVEWINSEK